ncbi:hypothetical protein EDD80_101589 [Anseongella ginsenosidimutans]|uniref:Uncharacterized protein n=1 Tax=Anseongella ginsenosidimutans TaxID=496056 RepID=A0A4R3KX51_9SPHI|nr:hypothetical protein [Anseongella ginsenosidimutans]QEC50967.1 hypothetical protein FRZ59_00425 [Anseongella ginsenosidimutans]TCS90389.1 hypothetical protein EDD80_101589 [Anseongella ginsenosidimutans]
MSILAGLRTRWAFRMLEKERNRRAVVHHSIAFGEAADIGILFLAQTLEDVLRIKDFAAYLKEQGKKVTVFGYTSPANETAFKTKSVFFDYLTEKDLNFFFIPSAQKTAGFLERPFDILINFCLEDCFPLTWLTAMSKATFRIGEYSPSRVPDLDLMIHLKEDRNIDNFALQLKQYLSLPASA